MKKSTKTFTCSDPSINVYGMTVNTDGIRIEDFLKNPVCLLNHNYDKVLGSWADLVKSSTTLSAVPVFDTEDEDGNKYYGQVERDVLKGASIGVIPIAVDGNEITECELLEISLTPVPANRNALVMYNAKGQVLNAKEAKAYMLSNNKHNPEDNNPLFMNPKLIAALVVLCANAEVTVQLSATPTDAEVQSAIDGIANKVTALKLSNTTLAANNEAYKLKENAVKEVEKTETLNLAVSEKRISESQRATFAKLWDADSALAKETLAAIAPVVLTVVPGAGAADAADESKWSFDDFAEKAPLKLSAMQEKEPERFNKLYAAKVAELSKHGQIAK